LEEQTSEIGIIETKLCFFFFKPLSVIQLVYDFVSDLNEPLVI